MRAGPKDLSKAAVRRKNGGSIWNVVRWLMMIGICYVILYPPLIKLSVALMSPGRQATKNGLFICVLRQLPAHLPVEMEEAAFVAGAGVDRTSWGVMTPNAVPVLVTAGVPAIDTIRLSMLTNAGALLITAQLLALFRLAQRFFAQGVERAGRTGMSRSLAEAFLTDRCNICCILHTNFALMKRLNIGYNLYDRAAQRQTTWQEGSVIKKTLLAIVGLMPAYWLDMTPTEKSRTYAEEMALIDEINQKYNCNLTFASTGDWHSHMSVVNTSLVNGEKIADVFWAGLWHGGAQAGGQRADCSAGRLF